MTSIVSFSLGVEDPPTQRGIIPRAFEHVFESITVTETAKFLVHASYLEIYNEEIRDLLVKWINFFILFSDFMSQKLIISGIVAKFCF